MTDDQAFVVTRPFHDRFDAGKQLAKTLSAWRKRHDVIVLALPRGGVPVAFEIARALEAPLDLILVRKLGAPGEEELAMGAIAMHDVTVLNPGVILNVSVSQEYLEHVVANEKRELARRNRLYRGTGRPPNLEGRVVLLVDDGVATGANIRAALGAVAQRNPARVIAAVPLAARETLAALKKEAGEVVCLHVPKTFFAVAQAYEDFTPVTDAEVLFLLATAREAEDRTPNGANGASDRKRA